MSDFPYLIAMAAFKAVELIIEALGDASGGSSDCGSVPPLAGKKPDSSSGGYSPAACPTFTAYSRLSSALENVSGYYRQDGNYVRSYVRHRPCR